MILQQYILIHPLGARIRVLVDVYDAPVLVTGAPAPTPGFLGLAALLFDCTVYDRHWSTEVARDGYLHSVAMGSVPVGEVVRLGLLSFGEDGDPPGDARPSGRGGRRLNCFPI